MAAGNTLELARQGDPAAIAVILTYHLSQRWNAVASAIRLGDYLSVLIDANFVLDRVRMITLVLSILSDLQIPGLATVEISTRQMGDREVQWSQTIELAHSPTPTETMTESPSSDWFTNPVAPDATQPTPNSPDCPPSDPTPAEVACQPDPDGREADPCESGMGESDVLESGVQHPQSTAEESTAEEPTSAIVTDEIPVEVVIAPTTAVPHSEAVVVPEVADRQFPEWSVATDVIMAEAIAVPAPAVVAPTPAIASDAPEPLSLSLVFQRPEIVALIAVAVILVLWESYAEWLNEPEPTEVLSKGKLARRLGVSRKVVDRVKGSSGFSQWSRELDPEGLAWRYEHPVFVPERSPLPAHPSSALWSPVTNAEGE